MPKSRRQVKPPVKKPTRTTRSAPAPARRALHYKVVELSNVDEGAVERTLNEWVPRGWTFDGVQFAMRESSKRPSMAFVFFTREGAPLVEDAGGPVTSPHEAEDGRYRAQAEAEAHLRRMAQLPAAAPTSPREQGDPWARLRALAGEEDQDEGLHLVARPDDGEQES